MGRHSNTVRASLLPPVRLPLPLRRTPARQLLSALPPLLLLCFSQACSKWHNFRFCFVAEITEIINKYARPSGHQSSLPLLPLQFLRNMANFWPSFAADFYAARRPVLSSFCLSLSTAWQSGSIIIINYHFVGIASAVTQQQQQQQQH